jgi:hypothetical protein
MSDREGTDLVTFDAEEMHALRAENDTLRAMLAACEIERDKAQLAQANLRVIIAVHKPELLAALAEGPFKRDARLAARVALSLAAKAGEDLIANDCEDERT